MKKLLFCVLSAVSLLAVQSASAIIAARQVWEHKDNPSKTVEILFDCHAENLPYTEKQEKELLLRESALRQKEAIIQHALSYGQNVHVWVEDYDACILFKQCKYSAESHLYNALLKIPRCILKEIFLIMHALSHSVSVLHGLSELCKKATIRCSNIEFRDKGDYTAIEKEVKNYDDGALLNDYYALLSAYTKNTDKNHQANYYLFDARLLHRVAHCDAHHQIVVVGGSHGAALAAGLPLMGYRQRGSTAMNRAIEKIVHSPKDEVDVAIQQRVQSFSMPKTTHEYCTTWLSKKTYSNRENLYLYWADVTLIAHPLDICAAVEQECKTVASSLPSAPPRALAPAVAALASTPPLVMPALRARL